MTTSADELFSEIAVDQALALEPVGGEIVEAIRQDLSVPVGITQGPRGGKKLVRSRRGEHPRKQTGKLQSEIAFRVDRDGVNVNLLIQSPTEYARFLDPSMDRPVLTGVDEQFVDRVTEAVAGAIAK